MPQTTTPHLNRLTLGQTYTRVWRPVEFLPLISLLRGWTATVSTRRPAPRIEFSTNDLPEGAGHTMLRCRGRQHPTEGVKTPSNLPYSSSALHFSHSERFSLVRQRRYRNLRSNHKHLSAHKGLEDCNPDSQIRRIQTQISTPYRMYGKTKQKGFDCERLGRIRSHDPERQSKYPRSSLRTCFRLPVIRRKTDTKTTPEVRHEDSLTQDRVTGNTVSPFRTNPRPQSYDEASRAARGLYSGKAHVLQEIPCPHYVCKHTDYYSFSRPVSPSNSGHSVPIWTILREPHYVLFPPLPSSSMQKSRLVTASDVSVPRSGFIAFRHPSVEYYVFPQKFPNLRSTSCINHHCTTSRHPDFETPAPINVPCLIPRSLMSSRESFRLQNLETYAVSPSPTLRTLERFPIGPPPSRPNS
ncbi:hypothetical protein EDB87DRAFT_1614879 [Lactarius vividus]|nr:hypothetical protein EDB87DRAFT_1614879 [Lactarius vividus]